MTIDPQQLTVAGDARVYVAPVGTAMPAWGTGFSETGSAWVDLGYTTPDGITMNLTKNINEIQAMQSFDPVRIVVTGITRTVAFTLMQTGAEQWALAQGGGTWEAVEGSTGVSRFTPPAASVVDERALAVQAIDGDTIWRVHCPRVQNRAGVEYKIQRNTEVQFPLTMQVLAPGGDAPSIEITSNAAYLAAA